MLRADSDFNFVWTSSFDYFNLSVSSSFLLLILVVSFVIFIVAVRVCALGREVYLDIWGRLSRSDAPIMGCVFSSATVVCSTWRALCASKLVLSSRLCRSDVSKAEEAAGRATRTADYFLLLFFCVLVVLFATEIVEADDFFILGSGRQVAGVALPASLTERRSVRGFSGIACA